jgi:hypothetical protein
VDRSGPLLDRVGLGLAVYTAGSTVVMNIAMGPASWEMIATVGTGSKKVPSR